MRISVGKALFLYFLLVGRRNTDAAPTGSRSGEEENIRRDGTAESTCALSASFADKRLLTPCEGDLIDLAELANEEIDVRQEERAAGLVSRTLLT